MADSTLTLRFTATKRFECKPEYTVTEEGLPVVVRSYLA